jgi:hypothetical protein
VPDHGNATTRAALVPPKLAFASVPAATKGSPAEFDATVDTVPDNTGSFDETVLSPGPWSAVAPKATVGALLGLAACTGNGDTTFTAKGKPRDAAVALANRQHEDHHVADDKAAFTNSIDAWDKKLAAAKKAGTKYHGVAKADAEAALHAAMGGTPDDIANAFADGCWNAGDNFHKTPAGGTVHASNPGATNADCSASWADFRI